MLVVAEMKLTEHFSLSEFERSSTAIANGIDNTVPQRLIPPLRNLCEKVLEPLRQQFCEPVTISSGYRCPELNRLVGGARNSQHLTGEAADIYIEDFVKLRKWYEWMKTNVPYHQLIYEGKGKQQWIHVSCYMDSKLNRHQAL